MIRVPCDDSDVIINHIRLNYANLFSPAYPFALRFIPIPGVTGRSKSTTCGRQNRPCEEVRQVRLYPGECWVTAGPCRISSKWSKYRQFLHLCAVVSPGGGGPATDWPAPCTIAESSADPDNHRQVVNIVMLPWLSPLVNKNPLQGSDFLKIEVTVIPGSYSGPVPRAFQLRL